MVGYSFCRIVGKRPLHLICIRTLWPQRGTVRYLGSTGSLALFLKSGTASILLFLSCFLSLLLCTFGVRKWLIIALHQIFHQRFYKSSDFRLPLSSPQIALFISYLSTSKLAPSTITSYLSAISYVHKIKGLQDPTKSFLILKRLTALGRQRSTDVRLPITRPVLHELVGSLRYTNSLPFSALCTRPCFW